MTDVGEVRSEHGMILSDLVRELPNATLSGDSSVPVFGVFQDSRRISPGDLFVARKGASVDGTTFIDEARSRGASALLVTRGALAQHKIDLPVIEVDDIADGLAFAAAAVYEHPSFGLEVIGVTGTNGKTTTTHLIRAAIDGALQEKKCGIIGTIGYRFASLEQDVSLTTPEADETARALLAMKRLGATHVAMEASSIALSVGRVRAVRFTVAAFTNLTQDHLDFHQTMEAYGAAKSKLFVDLAPGTAVICIDGEFGRTLVSKTRTRSISVSARVGVKADIVPEKQALSSRGIDATFSTPTGTVVVRSPLVGAHNVENIAVALGVIVALGLDVHAAAQALAGERGAPGRLERCDESHDEFAVFVDYAHTPDALARVLDALRAVCTGRLICVFGCGGDRDPTKRGPMGEAVAKRADVAIITNDNPRTEDPIAITLPIEAAVARTMPRVPLDADARGYCVELDRARAIELAIRNAAKNDVVLVAGKGHETYQIVGSEKFPFDDREEARAALRRIRERRIG